MPLGRGRFYWRLNPSSAGGTIYSLGEGLRSFGVGTETLAVTTDESGIILAAATGGTDDNNHVITTGPFAPRDGKMILEARFKYSNVDCAVFVGFSETLDTTTPVVPAEFSGSAMTYNGTGGMVGFSYDVDGTTDDFRAVMGDGGAAISDSSSGTRVNATLTADRWLEAKIELNEDGSAELWFGDSGHADPTTFTNLRRIKRFSTGTLLTTTDLFFPVLMIEARSGNARTLEVTHFDGSAGVDWRY